MNFAYPVFVPIRSGHANLSPEAARVVAIVMLGILAITVASAIVYWAVSNAIARATKKPWIAGGAFESFVAGAVAFLVCVFAVTVAALVSVAIGGGAS